MYKLDIQLDAKEAAAVERRRFQEQQRQKRIFNARERTIGLDVNALNKQAFEKKINQDVESQRNEAFATEMKRNDKIAELLQQRQEKDIAQLNKSLVEYRKEHQQPCDRREFDLYDPDSKKKDLPARVSDEDPRLTVSGMQNFDGEDLMHEKRKKLQQEQMREWVAQQTSEKQRLDNEEKHANHLYELKACELDQRAVDLAMAEVETRRALNEAHREYNKALAKEKEAQKQQERVQEQDDDYTELSNHIHGDMLTENPDVAQSAFGGHRVIPDRWKGMSPEQVGEVRAIQDMQKQEKEIRLKEEQELEREWERRRVTEAMAGMILDTQLAKKRRQLTKQLAEENRQLADEQRARQRRLNKEVYINPPTDAYFSQFNTSSR